MGLGEVGASGARRKILGAGENATSSPSMHSCSEVRDLETAIAITQRERAPRKTTPSTCRNADANNRPR